MSTSPSPMIGVMHGAPTEACGGWYSLYNPVAPCASFVYMLHNSQATTRETTFSKKNVWERPSERPVPNRDAGRLAAQVRDHFGAECA